MSDKSNAGTISLPKGGGAISGMGEKFSPDLFTGTGNFSVPLAVPPGRNGLQPELTLGYSTGGGNSAFGLGWNLGVPGVQRKTSKGIPRYDDERDVFILSGAEDLVPIARTELVDAGGTLGHKVQYRPRTEGLFARIEHYVYQDGRNYWQVRSKDGLVSYYGHEHRPVTVPGPTPSGPPVANPANPAVLTDPLHPAHVFAWHLTRTTDPFGNEIVYDYEREIQLAGPHQYGQTYLRRIRYGDYQAPGGGTTAPTRYLLSVELDYAPTRPDPFSTYDAGFEQRTTQRCVAVRTYTHPETADLPFGHPIGTDPLAAIDPTRNGNRVAVKTYALGYVDEFPGGTQALNAASLLHQVQVTGHDASRPAGEQNELMPPLTFGYSGFAPDLQRFFPVTGPLPATSLANGELELLSIFGNGLPDLVQLGGGQPRYWRNLGDGRFAEPRPMNEAPGGLLLADPDVQFFDATGDGKPDLLVNREGLAGYFPLNFNGQWDRNSFRHYRQRPSFSLADPEVKMLDLDGDGITDVLRNGSRFEYFYNDPEQGFVAGPQVGKGQLDSFPDVSFQDPRVRLAHLCSGLQCVAMVHSGRVEYWPNLGRGRWGQRVTMKKSPVLPRSYNPAHVLLGDVDGDGLDDFIHVENNKLTLWLNQSGNGWSAPIEITGTPALTDASAVRVIDLLGTGVAGVLWTRDAVAVGNQQQYLFLDLTGRVKPYVLNQLDNHLGALTRVAYAPSTRFYLADQRKPATRWQTPLPMPVQVVAHVEVIDQLSGGKMTTEYSYHHGYWDGGEREFRGFGRVDQRDTQSFARYNSDGLFADAPAPLAGSRTVTAEHYAPPLETRTWFHLGPVGDGTGEWRELDFSPEYWVGDAPLLTRPPGMAELLRGLPRRQRRDAVRALRGTSLRTELYALDGTSRQLQPYTVTESLPGVAQVRGLVPATPGGLVDSWLVFDARPALPTGRQAQDFIGGKPVFFAHSLAQRTTQWERGIDPQTSFSFTADYDPYGQARLQLSAALPRKWDRQDAPAAEALVSFGTTHYAGYGPTASRNDYDTAGQYMVDRAAATESWELVTTGTSLTVWDLLTEARALPNQQQLTRRRLGHALHYYDGNGFDGRPFGELEGYGALTRSAVLVLTQNIMQAAYGSVPTLLQPGRPSSWSGGWPAEYPASFRSAFNSTYPAGTAGYYTSADAEYVPGGYYQLAERRQYDFQFGSGQGHRGLVRLVQNPLGRIGSVSYDDYALLPVLTVDALGNQTTAQYDYRLLQPWLVTDLNLNRTACGYSPLGLLRETALLGKEGQQEGDLVHEAVPAQGGQPAQPMAYAASTRLDYDLFAFARAAQPCWVRTHQREQHYQVSATSKTLVKTEYSDGFDRLLQTRTQAEEVCFGDPITGGGSGLPADLTAPNQPAVGQLNTDLVQVNVVVSGWQVYDNKGRVVIKYEPFFSTGFEFHLAETAARGQGVKMQYDPRGQLVRTTHPDGSQQRVVYGVPGPDGLSALNTFEPTPWETYSYDANDLAPLTHPGQGWAPAAHAYTPQSSRHDALGRVVQTTDRLEAATPGGPLTEVVMHYAYDLRGNRTQVTDALGRVSFQHLYDLMPRDGGANALWTRHLDGGAHVAFFDGAGDALGGTDAKGAWGLHTSDALGRPTGMWARDRTGEALTRRQHFSYGTDASQNTNGQLVEHYDEGGRTQLGSFDFRGRAGEKSWQTLADVVFTKAWDKAAAGSWATLPAGFNYHWEDVSAAAVTARLASTVYQTSTTYDALGRPTQLTLPAEAGRSGARAELVPTYNRAGALAQVRLDGELLIAHLAYNARGQRLLLARGNGLLTRYAYDPTTFRLARQRTEAYAESSALTLTPQSGTVRQDTGYRYDLSGNIIATRERAPQSGIGSSAELLRGYSYDALYRLLSATGRENQPTANRPWQQSTRSAGAASTTAYTQSYQYDLLGNIAQLKHMAANSADSFTRTFDYGSKTTNYLQSAQMGSGAGTAVSYQYDAAGNVVQENGSRHYQWDGADQLQQFATWTGAGSAPTLLAHYLYSGGQRVKKLTQTSAGTWQVTVYAGGGFEHRYKVSQGTISGEQTQVAVLDGPQRLYQRRSGDALGDQRPAVLYALADHLGSAVAQTDAVGGLVSREEYYPFGETSFGSHEKQRYRYCGKELDQESGLYYYGARYYAPYLCRFVSVDPLAAKYTYYTPYQYAGNRPINFIDLDGAEPASPAGSAPPATSSTRPAATTVPSTPSAQSSPGFWGTVKNHLNDIGADLKLGHLDYTEEERKAEADVASDSQPGTGKVILNGISNTWNGMVELVFHPYDTVASGASSVKNAYNYVSSTSLSQMGTDIDTKMSNNFGKLDGQHLERQEAGVTAGFNASLLIVAIKPLRPSLNAAPAPPAPVPPAPVPEYLNFASAQRTKHILAGDATGGGHRWLSSAKSFRNGVTGTVKSTVRTALEHVGLTNLASKIKNFKSMFPATWSEAKVMHAITEVAMDSKSTWVNETGPQGAYFTKAGAPAKFQITGYYEGVKIRVILRANDIITAFPIK